MACSQDLLQLDNEIGRINFMRDSDYSLPVLPSPDVLEDVLENGLNTPPVTPLHLPHGFIKEERELFSPPPVINVIPTESKVQSPSITPDNIQIGSNLTPCNPVKEEKSTALRKRAACPTSLTLPSEEYPLKRIKSEPEATYPNNCCLLYTSPSPRDATLSRMPSSA